MTDEYGPRVTAYSSLEEMLTAMGQAEDEANAKRLLAPQREVTWGSYTFKAEMVGEQEALAVWGHVWSLEEYQEKERKAGAEEDELRYSTERLVDAHERGYRYGDWWSVVCSDRPDLGSSHVSVLWPITRRDFEYARRNGWRMGHEIWERLRHEVFAAEKEDE
jgi:hypothetical protein